MYKSISMGVAALLLASSTSFADTYNVTSSSDSGKDTLRAAILDASSKKGPHTINVHTSDIVINKPLSYSGSDLLNIYGEGQRITSNGNFNIIESTNGADLAISSLNLIGPGGFDINNRGDINEDAGKGVFVDVRDDQEGIVNLILTDVKVANVANHGIHISDCNLADDCGGGGGGAGEGSPASISVTLNYVTVDNVGQGKMDADGLRVDERGIGSIHATINNSSFKNVGADGVELDEGQSGSVLVSVIDSSFIDNGTYCHPNILESFMPAEDEGEFDDYKIKENEIPAAIVGSPDDTCFEREVSLYDSGYVEEYEFAIDTDDGFDIDEAGPGDLTASIIDTMISGNFDEGLDFDEEGAGSINMIIVNSNSMNNSDDGYKHSESDDGDVNAYVLDSRAYENGGKGFVFEEEDEGNVAVTVVDVMTTANDDSDDTGLEVVQDDDGNGSLTIRSSDISDGIDDDGVIITQK